MASKYIVSYLLETFPCAAVDISPYFTWYKAMSLCNGDLLWLWIHIAIGYCTDWQECILWFAYTTSHPTTLPPTNASMHGYILHVCTHLEFIDLMTEKLP